MSDTTLNKFLAFGTAAERIAFTPSPPPEDTLYLWYETDTDETWGYDTTWHQLTTSGGAGITELTGDVTAGPGSGSQATTLASTAATPGTFGSSTTTPVITVDAKGRITASAETAIAAGGVTGAGSSVDGEGVLFSGTSGNLLQRATGTGVVHRTSGVDSVSAVALGADVSGDLPFANIVQASGASKLVGRGSASGAGDFQEITLGTNLALSGTTLNATGGGDVTTTGSPASGNLTKFSGAATITNADLTGDVTTSGTVATTIANDAVTYAKIQNISAASRLLGRGSASGSGDTQEITAGNSVAITSTTLDTIQDIRTSATPQFARLGLGAAADSSAVGKFTGQYYSPLVADGNSGTTKTLDFDAGNEHYLTLTGNVTLTLSNPKDGGRYVILFNSGGGGFTVTWPTAGSAGGVKWPGGTAPTITVTAAKVDLVTLIYVLADDRYYGAFNQNY